MKNITLCAINSKYIHSCPAVYYLEAGLKAAMPEMQVSIIEASVNDTAEHILYSVFESAPEIVGFSVYIWNVATVAKLCKSIRAVNPDIRIILGGPEVSYGIAHTDIKESDYDLIISGEGERAFPEAVKIIAEGKQVKEKTVSAPFIQSLDDIPFIYNESNIDNFKNRIIYYETSRGCPFSCAYCLSSVCGNVRFLSLERDRKSVV